MNSHRITALMLLCVLTGTALIVRSAWIQLARSPRLEAMAKKQFETKVLVKPRRGMIVDSRGEPLAVNIETNSLAANPLKIKNKKHLAWLLSKATDLPAAKILSKLSENREFVWIKRHLQENEFKGNELKGNELNKFKRWRVMDEDGDLVNGLWLVKESKRVYPHRELASHTIGTVGVDSDGLEGVELAQDEKLRGKVFSVHAVKDALGRPAFLDMNFDQKTGSDTAKKMQNGMDGESVTLTLDASLQFAVEEELRTALRKTGSISGSVIVMNAMNGEIVALANEPSFNPNDKGTPPDHRRNRVFTDGYEPGSTLKPILLAGALNNGSKLTDLIWGERGQFTVQGKRIAEAEAHEKFEWLTLKDIIRVSSNVGAAKLALKLGADHYLDTLKTFGFGTKVDSGFPGEISGRIPPKKGWKPLTLANIGFGQGILVTRIQLIRAYATFLNGGWLVHPKLFKTDQDHIDRTPPKKLLTQHVCDQVIEALRAAASKDGTGFKSALDGYLVAGKTGTAQTIDKESGKYSRSKFIASFIGFPIGIPGMGGSSVPIGGDPKFVIFTSLSEPRGVYYGSETAAPLFREVLSTVVNRFSIPAQTKQLATLPIESPNTQNDHLVTSQAKQISLNLLPASSNPALKWAGLQPHGEAQWTMPNVQGLTAREALKVFQNHRFKMELQGFGLVAHQFPHEGTIINEGGAIHLTLSE